MISIRTLTVADTQAIEQVRQYFRNYAAWLGVDLSYQNFDQEMASLPGAYTAPEGRLFFAEVNGRPAGCVGVRPLPDSEGVCEMKRLYVDPEQRGHGVGNALALAAIKAAKEIGYRKLIIDTLPSMRMAVKLYRELGFTEAPAYYKTPVEGTMFLALDLENWSEEEIRSENLSHLFDFNRAWARKMQEVDPDYFNKLSKIQTPELLWIGCSDSPVPANEIVGLLQGARIGLADNWLRHVQDVHAKHLSNVDSLPAELRHARLCELNVLEQVWNVCQTYVVQDAWRRGQPVTVHGWIYGLKDGLMHDLGITVNCPEDLQTRYDAALKALDA